MDFSLFMEPNRYSGAAFPGLVAVTFSALGVNVFSLRLLGGVLDRAAVALVMATFWRRGNAPFPCGSFIRVVPFVSLLQQGGLGGLCFRELRAH